MRTIVLELFLLLHGLKIFVLSLVSLSVFTIECVLRMVTYIPRGLTLAEVILVTYFYED